MDPLLPKAWLLWYERGCDRQVVGVQVFVGSILSYGSGPAPHLLCDLGQICPSLSSAVLIRQYISSRKDPALLQPKACYIVGTEWSKATKFIFEICNVMKFPEF